MKKYIETIKKSIIGGIFFALTVFGVTYAINITNYTQTATSGDVMTAEWANSIGDAIESILPINSTKIDNTSVQQRINGNCSEGSSIRSINSDGTVVCEVDNGGLSSVTSTEIVDNTITEDDISDNFKARDSDLLDGVNGSDYALKTYVDGKVSNTGGGKRVEKWSGSSSSVTNSWGVGSYKVVYKPSSVGYNIGIFEILTTSGNYLFSGAGGGTYYTSSASAASYLNLYNKFYSGNTSWYIVKIYKFE